MVYSVANIFIGFELRFVYFILCIFLQVKAPVYDLLDIPDEMLTPDQLSSKKRQKMLKNAREGRLKAQAVQREKRQKVSIQLNVGKNSQHNQDQ